MVCYHALPLCGRNCVGHSHDEDAEIYLNGALAASLPGFITDYDLFDISQVALTAVHPPVNVPAVYLRCLGHVRYYRISRFIVPKGGSIARAIGPGDGGQFAPSPPQLEGIKINNRWVVIYSRYDLGCALEKHQSSDCLGHDFASAIKLAGAAVYYALQR